MNGAGESEDIDAGGVVFQKKAGNLFERGAEIEEVVNDKDAPACYITVYCESARHVVTLLHEGMHFFLRLGLAGFDERCLHGLIERTR